MIWRTETSDRDLLISERDFDSLNRLVHSPRYRSTEGAHVAVLRDELEQGRVVAAERVPRRLVTMHSRVRVRDLKSHRLETYELVLPEEADIDEGRISVLAPLGTALLGSQVGQTVHVHAPAGVRKLKVERILYQPPAAGEQEE